MITNKDLSVVNLSATKKDFYQIWNELLDIAGKISNRWDPTSTNESDPGIVLLKVLTAVADKLNYNIDKNILEAFMPSAAQRESMMKLCAMMGYNMKYYRSAETKVTIAYRGVDSDGNTIDLPEDGLILPEFTNITDTDKKVNYVTKEQVTFRQDNSIDDTNVGLNAEVGVIEGQYVQCETDNNNLITVSDLDDNNRYYLPETMIAENGIFINSIDANNKAISWKQKDNLNSQRLGTRVYQFGYDSREGKPYIQFPDDVGQLMLAGLTIAYLRTSGVNGNISAGTLNTFTAPTDSLWDNYQDVDTLFEVSNTSAATNGANPESITQAYNAYKKTIGTFDTLITCRDYMNKIYNLLDEYDTPYVSNVLVTDIRSDLNRAYTLCTYNNYGILYEERPYKISKVETDTSDDSDVVGQDASEATDNGKEDVDTLNKAITQFDLILYPFKTYAADLKNNYDRSFTYSSANVNQINEAIEGTKAISHTIKNPGTKITYDNSLGHRPVIAAIKNYLKLDAKITTTVKVNAVDEANILQNIKTAIYSAFNMRQLDFGEEIPFESILEVIQKADSRIKNVALEEPALYTAFLDTAGDEYSATAAKTNNDATYDDVYAWLTVRNILAGRVALFNYYNEFKPELTQAPYTKEAADITINVKDENSNLSTFRKSDIPEKLYTTSSTISVVSPDGTETIEAVGELTEIKGLCQLSINKGKRAALTANEVVRFAAPSYKTSVTYPAYVNYYLHLADGSTSSSKPAVFAKMQLFTNYLYPSDDSNKAKEIVYKSLNNKSLDSPLTSNDMDILVDAGYFRERTEDVLNTIKKIKASKEFTDDEAKNAALRDKLKNKYLIIIKKETKNSTESFELLNLNTVTMSDDNTAKYTYYTLFNSYITFTSLLSSFLSSTGQALYIKGDDPKYMPGYLVDNLGYKYQKLEQAKFSEDNFLTKQEDKSILYLNEVTRSNDVIVDSGLGENATYDTIKANAEYKLKQGDYLCINYTKSSNSASTNENATSQTSEIINETYGTGTVICPNFDLVDSSKYHLTHSYSKTSGFTFDSNIASVPPEGMFTMGTNEQIAIREPAEISFGTKISGHVESLTPEPLYLYWTLNTAKPEFTEEQIFGEGSGPNIQSEYANIIKIFKNTPGFSEGSNDQQNNKIYRYSYTLGDGEYLYYTNSSKASLAYYGAGTEIVIYSNKQSNKHLWEDSSKNTNSISANEVLEKGLRAIPWQQFTFGSSQSEYNLLQLKEYRYIDLTAGDLISTDNDYTGTKDGNLILNNTYRHLSKAESAAIKYRIGGGEEQTLPDLDYSLNNGGTWSVRSYLALNVGPQVTQILQPDKDKLVLTYTGVTANNEKVEKIVAITPLNSMDPVSVRTSLPIQTDGIINFAKAKENLGNTKSKDSELFNEQIKALDNFKLETFVSTPIVAKSETASEGLEEKPISLISLSNGLTKFSTSALIEAADSDSSSEAAKRYYLEFNINLPESTDPEKTKYNGIMMFYYAPVEGDNNMTTANLPYFTFEKQAAGATKEGSTADEEDEETDLVIFNNLKTSTTRDTDQKDQKYSWWNDTDMVTDNRFKLRVGLNTVCITKSGKLRLHIANGMTTGIVVYSQLDIINRKETGLNPELGLTSRNAFNTVLNTIRGIDTDHNFFYNCPILPDLAISFGGSASDVQTLADSAAWYDPNNINNNFVISEIDSNYLDKGIKIANSSKL